MGKVFTWDDIVTRNIPDQAAFTTVTDSMRRLLEANPGVVGGTFFGSSLSSAWNPRSDIDYVVVYDHEQREEVFSTIRQIRQLAAAHHVPTDAILIDRQMAGVGVYRMRQSFASHLQHAIDEGGTLVRSPLPFLIFDPTHTADDLRIYLRNKLQSLEEGIIALPGLEGHAVSRFLQVILESPLHIARNVLSLFRLSENPGETSKGKAVSAYLTLTGVPERDQFLRLVAVDHRYSAELLEQISRPNASRYSQIMKEIQDQAPEVLAFIRLNAIRFIPTTRIERSPTDV
jgi:predicted nucleotidyltransferase